MNATATRRSDPTNGISETAVSIEDLEVPARDGFRLAATLFRPEVTSGSFVIISSATAVPRGFYRHLAGALAEAGNLVLTYDYRGIGGSRPRSLRGFRARMRDWALQDMEGVVQWAKSVPGPDRLLLLSHSVGGQVAGLLEDPDPIDGMMTFSSQSGFWNLQGKGQRLPVFFHVHMTLPLLSHLCGYMPWSVLGPGEDLPKGVALEWSGWCRNREYLLGDETLPLDRYRNFTAPVIAYSFEDDTWGTARSVDAMMKAYPNLERRHVKPAEVGLRSIGHFGFFKPESRILWDDVIAWAAGS